MAPTPALAKVTFTTTDVRSALKETVEGRLGTSTPQTSCAECWASQVPQQLFHWMVVLTLLVQRELHLRLVDSNALAVRHISLTAHMIKQWEVIVEVVVLRTAMAPLLMIS